MKSWTSRRPPGRKAFHIAIPTNISKISKVGIHVVHGPSKCKASQSFLWDARNAFSSRQHGFGHENRSQSLGAKRRPAGNESKNGSKQINPARQTQDLKDPKMLQAWTAMSASMQRQQNSKVRLPLFVCLFTNSVYLCACLPTDLEPCLPVVSSRTSVSTSTSWSQLQSALAWSYWTYSCLVLSHPVRFMNLNLIW